MKNISYITLAVAAALCLTSCEGCVKKVAKKATAVSLSAAEGVAEALSEHGDVVTEKAADAVGSMAKGAGRSIDRQLGEGKVVTEITGSMYDQVLGDSVKAACDQIKFVYDETQGGVNMEFLGALKTEPSVLAYFMIPNADAYTVNISCIGGDDDELMAMKGEIQREDADKPTCVALRFDLGDDEMERLKDAKAVRVTIRKK